MLYTYLLLLLLCQIVSSRLSLIISARGILPRVRLLVIEVLDESEISRRQRGAHARSDPVDPVVAWESGGSDGGAEAAGGIERAAGVEDAWCGLLVTICGGVGGEVKVK